MDSDIPRTIPPRDLGQRLQSARKARGLTQEEAAEQLAVARTTLVAIEKGQRRVQPSELIRLAALYGRSVGELLRTGTPDEEFAVQLRSTLAPATAIETTIEPAVWEFQRLCEDYRELEHICRAPLPRAYPPPYTIDHVAPEAAAEDVATAERHRLGLGDGPLLNLREVLEGDVGLRIFLMDLPRPIAAMFAYTEGLGGCIAANGNHPAERRRMSVAHDYGHFLTNRYRPEVRTLGRYHRQPEHERFAESFAQVFLLPATGLRRRFHDLHRGREGRLTPADLCRLAHLYFVSVEALTRRLEDLRLLPVGTWDRLQQQGFRVREARALLELPPQPVDDDALPTRYRYLAVEAFERGDISEGQLARFLRADRLEARRQVEALTNRTVVNDDGLAQQLAFDFGAPLPGQKS